MAFGCFHLFLFLFVISFHNLSAISQASSLPSMSHSIRMRSIVSRPLHILQVALSSYPVMFFQYFPIFNFPCSIFYRKSVMFPFMFGGPLSPFQMSFSPIFIPVSFISLIALARASFPLFVRGSILFLLSMCVTVVTPSQLRYSCYSGNVLGPHITLRVELLTPFTSTLPFLLCSSFVLSLLIRKHHLVVLLFCSIVLRSQTHL